MPINRLSHSNKFSIIFFLGFLLLNQNELRAEPAGIKMLDSLINVLSSNPNKALQLGFNILELPEEELPDSIKAFTKLEIGYILDKQGFSSQALTFYLEAAELLTEIGLKPISGYLFIDIGNIYYKRKQYKSAIEKYNNAIEIFSHGENYRGIFSNKKKSSLVEEEKKNYKYGGVYTSTNNLALVEQSQKNYPSALKYFNEALNIALNKLDLPYLIAHSYGYLGSLYNEMGNSDSALYYYDKALLIEMDKEEANLFGLNHKRKAEIYLIKKDTLNALVEFDLAEKDFKKELNVYYLIELYLQQYNVFKTSNYNKNILEHLNKAYLLAEKDGFIDKQIEIIKNLVDYYEAKGNNNLIIENQSKLAELLEIKYETDVSAQISKIDIQQQIDLYQQKLKIADLKLANEELYRNASIIIITVLVIILWLLFARYKYKKKYHQQVLQSIEANHLKELEIEKLQRDQANRELVIQTANIQKQNDFLFNLKKQLKSNKTEGSKENEVPVKKILSSIEAALDKDSSWKQFEEQFIKVHPDFFKKITEKYPALTGNELRLCAYHKMNLGTKEIGSLMNLSMRSIQSIRYRLRKKLNISAETQFQEFINRL